MSYDLNIDEAKAKYWIEDVNHEIALVKELLTKVSDASTTTPQEEDDIMKGIASTCTTMRTFWDKMCDGFGKTIDKLKDAVTNMVNATNQAVEDAKTVENKVGT